MISVFIAAAYYKVHILLIIVVCGVIGVIDMLIMNRKKLSAGGEAQ
jgi:hypothetical protein